MKKELQRVIASCNNLPQGLESQIFRPSPPWFYTKEGIDMAAFFQKTPAAKQYAIYIVESFEHFLQERSLKSICPPCTAPEQLPDIYHMIKVLVDEIQQIKDQNHYLLDNEIKPLQNLYRQLKNQVDHLATLVEQNLLPASATARALPLSESVSPISTRQRQQLRQIAILQAPNRRSRMHLWSDFKRKFDIHRYGDLSQERFDEAVRWLQEWAE